MFSFFIRLRSVFGCRPSITAAPFGPSMTQFASAGPVRRDCVRPDSTPDCPAPRDDGPSAAVSAGGRKSSPSRNTGPLGEHNRSRQQILEFANIARPRIVHEPLHGFIRNRSRSVPARTGGCGGRV